jgi:hypothetical protein
MANLRDSAQQIKAALDKIAAVKDNPQQVQAAVDSAKQHLDQMVQQSDK